MQRKSFERGTVAGGLIRICIAVIAIIVAVVVLVNAIQNWDPEEIGGKVFMCAVGAFFMLAGITFIVYGVQMIVNGRKSMEVSRKGHPERGRIIDLTINEVTERTNGAVTHYNVYTLKFEYTDDNGNLCESSEQISLKVFNKLQEMKLVPILVLGERAIFDKHKFEEENFIGG